jgi:hypothetical protein
MKKTMMFTLVFIQIFKLDAQSYLNKRNIQFGTSLTYTKNDARTAYNVKEQQYMWSFNIATSVSKRVQVGVENIALFHTEYKEKNFVRSNMFGIFGQYVPIVSQKGNFYLELSTHYGNLCTCDPDMPYRKPEIWYYGAGFGLNYKIHKNLFLDLGFNNYQIFNKIPGKYNNTRYVVGLNYILNFKETVRSF